MSEENKIVVGESITQNRFFRHFAAVALGTFVGGFCAINLFCALNKPPMMPMAPMMYPPMGHQVMDGHFKKHHDCPCHKKMMKKFMEDKGNFKKEIGEDKDE